MKLNPWNTKINNSIENDKAKMVLILFVIFVGTAIMDYDKYTILN